MFIAEALLMDFEWGKGGPCRSTWAEEDVLTAIEGASASLENLYICGHLEFPILQGTKR